MLSLTGYTSPASAAERTRHSTVTSPGIASSAESHWTVSVSDAIRTPASNASASAAAATSAQAAHLLAVSSSTRHSSRDTVAEQLAITARPRATSSDTVGTRKQTERGRSAAPLSGAGGGRRSGLSHPHGSSAGALPPAAPRPVEPPPVAPSSVEPQRAPPPAAPPPISTRRAATVAGSGSRSVVEGSSLAPLLAAALEEARRRAGSADSAGSTGSAGSAGSTFGSRTETFALAIAVLEEELSALRVAYKAGERGRGGCVRSLVSVTARSLAITCLVVGDTLVITLAAAIEEEVEAALPYGTPRGAAAEAEAADTPGGAVPAFEAAAACWPPGTGAVSLPFLPTSLFAVLLAPPSPSPSPSKELAELWAAAPSCCSATAPSCSVMALPPAVWLVRLVAWCRGQGRRGGGGGDYARLRASVAPTNGARRA